eukprot:86037_1
MATTTTSTTNAYRPSKYDTSPKYNVHWYNIQSKAFGFASTSTIDVIRRSGNYEWYDTAEDGSQLLEELSNDRLSWSFYQDGYRAGTYFLNGNNNWMKIIYYKQCAPTTSPTPAPTLQPTISPTMTPTLITLSPTDSPTISPTFTPSGAPTTSPTLAPTLVPTTSPTLSPTHAPTIAPTFQPTDAPSNAPTDSPYRMITINEPYICGKLSGNIDVIYDIDYHDCVYTQCLYTYTSSCAMISYLGKTETSPSKCYVFAEQCKIYADNNNNNNFIALRGWKHECIDYPTDWTDQSGDKCYKYSNIFNWCNDGNVTDISNFDENSKNLLYNYDPTTACCECGGGAIDRNNVILEFSESDNILNGVNTSDNICDWAYGHKPKWYDYNNMDLYDLCDKSNEVNYNPVNCEIVFDKSYSGQSDIILCNFNGYNDDDLYWISMFTLNHKMISNIYINEHWFSLDDSLFFIDNKPLLYYNYTGCMSSLFEQLIVHAVLPCDVDFTLEPTSAPTNELESVRIFDTLIKLFKTDETEQLAFLVNVLLISIFVTLIILSSCCAKLRNNDFLKVRDIATAMFESLDMVSDVFFVVHISTTHSLSDPEFNIIIIASMVFLAIPILYSLAQLFSSNRIWSKQNESIDQWLIDNMTFLFFLSIITGPFSAVLLVNSYLFGLPLFSMGLDKKNKNKFEKKRIRSVIFCEDIPQLIIQSVYLSKIQ